MNDTDLTTQIHPLRVEVSEPLLSTRRPGASPDRSHLRGRLSEDRGKFVDLCGQLVPTQTGEGYDKTRFFDVDFTRPLERRNIDFLHDPNWI